MGKKSTAEQRPWVPPKISGINVYVTILHIAQGETETYTTNK